MDKLDVHIYPIHIWSGTVPVQTVPVQFGSVRDRVRPYLIRNDTTCPHYKLSGPNFTRIIPQNTGSRIGTERYRMSDSFTDVDRWSGTVPITYRSKNARMDWVNNCFAMHCW